MPNIFTGDADNNYIVSANGDDIIYGLDGVDELHGRGGSDQLFGGNGEDNLFGEDGTDTLDGGAGNDQLDGGYGNDTLTGGTGDDIFTVNDDTDTITDLGLGNDVLSVGPGAVANATVVQAWTATAATINDGTVNLVTAGFAVDLSLAGGGTGFTVTNTGDATTLTGSAQDDTLISGAGADVLIGGGGNDKLVSHTHTATVVYTGNQADYTVTSLGHGSWQVVDINLADGDSGTDTLTGIPTVQFADATVDLPVNHAPVVAVPVGDQAINEDTALSFQVPAGTFSDPDVGAYQRYSIVGGADAGLFKVSAKTGALYFNGPQNFENPADANHDGTYDVIVKVSDGHLTDTQTVHVTVGNIANEILKGTAGDNVVQGADGADRLYGLAGNDTLDGGTGNDRLYGGLGADTLLGGSGNDRLYGGEGQDFLTGGSGRDMFVFDLAPGTPGNADVITDFAHAQGDKIALSMADFTGFTHTGTISADQFYAAAGATVSHDVNDRIIYNTTDGALYYDADGLGGADAVQIATIQSHATANLGYYDILIVA